MRLENCGCGEVCPLISEYNDNGDCVLCTIIQSEMKRCGINGKLFLEPLMTENWYYVELESYKDILKYFELKTYILGHDWWDNGFNALRYRIKRRDS